MSVAWNTDDHVDWQILDLTGTGPRGSAAARRWAQDRLGALAEPHLFDTVLVIGELLDNAHRHAGGPVQLRLRHSTEPCETTVAVSDTGSGSPALRVPDVDGGRGLLLVDQVCAAWGVSHHDDGKVVWAKLSCAQAALGQSSRPCRGSRSS